jgi:hypothetical protein
VEARQIHGSLVTWDKSAWTEKHERTERPNGRASAALRRREASVTYERLTVRKPKPVKLQKSRKKFLLAIRLD